MTESESDWIHNYGFILVAFAHMTDWKLADSEIQVIQDKMEFMFANAKQPYAKEEVAETVVTIIEKYHVLQKKEDGEKE